MIKSLYNNFRNIIRTIYFIPLEGGWVSITVSVFGSLILLPIVTVIVLLTHIIKLFDILWIKLSYLNCKERKLLLEPLNDVDYLMWRTKTFGQPLIMCFFVTDYLSAESIIKNLVWRIENKDAFRGTSNEKKNAKLDDNKNNSRENKRFFCTVESSLGRLWFKYTNNDYNTSDHIIKVSPIQARYILKNPYLILDQDSNKTLAERLIDHENYIKLEEKIDSLTETEMRKFYSILFSCEGIQLSIKRPCWRIIILDNVFWKGSKSSVMIGQFHHVIGDGSTLTEFVTKTVLDFPDIKDNKTQINGVTKSARFWHRWVSGLLWAAIAGPITLLKAALQARPERSWNSPTKKRSKRSNKIGFSGPINIPLSDVKLLKDKLNNQLNVKFKPENNKNSNITRRRDKTKNFNENNKDNLHKKERVKFSKRITFNDIILSCVASGYTKYVNYYISNHELSNNSSNSTDINTPTSGYSIQSNSFESNYLFSYPLISTPKIKKDYCEKETFLSSPIHFDDKSPYSSVLKYDSISGSHDMDHITDNQIQNDKKKIIDQIHDNHHHHHHNHDRDIYENKNINKENDLSALCHSNLNIVVTTNNRTKPPTKLDNAFSTIVLPIPTCPKATPSERLKCVFESLQEYRKTSLPIIFIRYVQYTLSFSPFALLCLWIPHSRSCSMYYSSVPGPKECSFINKSIKDMTFALPLTDHIGLGLSIFTFEDQVSVSITYDEDIIINPDLFLESIKLSFDELKSGVLSMK